MKYIINLRVLTLLFSIVTADAFSQTTLYVSTGTNFYIVNNTYVYVDGLRVKPSSDYNITGENSITRDATATPPPLTPYIQRVYHLLQTLTGYSGDITIYYQDVELNGLNENTLNLNVYNGTAWNVYPPTSKDAVNNFVTTAGLVGIAINEATLAAPDVVLPVTLKNFTAQNNRCVANLKWTTATEQNSKHFEVQHSTDAVTFTTVGIIPSSGNSNTEKHYNFSSSLSSQSNYFRLRMVDIDGTSKFSPIVSVTSNCSNSVITLYPNPTRNMVTVTGLTEGSQLRLLDNIGQVLTSIKNTSRSETINLSTLPAGTYVIQVVQNNKVIENIKIIKE